jgi:hypothetical protein
MRGNTFFWRETVRACRKCHDDIHYYFSHLELATQFNQPDLLRMELKQRKELDV